MPNNKIFISSTQDLQLMEERNTVEKVARELGFDPRRAESFPQRSMEVRPTISKHLRECEIYIGILGGRYGSHPDDESTSWTQTEFNAAQTLDRYILLYLKKTDIREPEQQVFVDSLFTSLFRHPEFTSVDELENQVRQDLIFYLQEQPRNPRESKMSEFPRIMIVEDNPEDLKAIKDGLKILMPNSDIRGLTSGIQALETVKDIASHHGN